jgi:hypothetical protein
MGGSDDEDNLTPPISHALHAEFHRQLWLDFGHWQDFIAWRMLSGRISPETARLEAAKHGQEKSESYKNSRKASGKHLQRHTTKESCSKGGKLASVKLVRWQKANAERFAESSRRNGRDSKVKLQIRHMYLGVVYESKKALQKAHKMSICGFYGKLGRGEILRLSPSPRRDAASKRYIVAVPPLITHSM